MGTIFSLLSACFPSSAPSRFKPLTEITADQAGDGFVDLDFVIRSYEQLPDGSQIIGAYGLDHGHEVGVAVTLGSHWKERAADAQLPLVTYRGMVTYHSLGAASDALLEALNQLYGTKLSLSTMRHDISFTGISLGGKPADLKAGKTEIKLFFESGTEADYAELYTNIDLEKGVLQIHEKDPEYRAAIIRALRVK